MIQTESCGCQNVETVLGLVMSLSKCDFHLKAQREPHTLDAAYFAELGISPDNLENMPHFAELEGALGPFSDGHGKQVLEIGCGLSPYAGRLIKLGYEYFGVEPSSYAAATLRSKYNVAIFETPWPLTQGISPVDLILSAHCLEHLANPVEAVERMAETLNPEGKLRLVVPEGTDRVNPDHLVFFTRDSLASLVEFTHLKVDSCVAARRVPHERFLYLEAHKV